MAATDLHCVYDYETGSRSDADSVDFDTRCMLLKIAVLEAYPNSAELSFGS
jgi:hypothetical protein